MFSYEQIQVADNQDGFLFKGRPLFDRKFTQVLKFHKEGLAAVADESGWFHISLDGEPLYEKRFERTFGYYFGRSAVNDAGQWYHLDTKGKEAYSRRFAWCGNFQESLCTVRDFDNHYCTASAIAMPAISKTVSPALDWMMGFGNTLTQTVRKSIP